MTKENLGSLFSLRNFKKLRKKKKFRQCGFAECGPGAGAKMASSRACAHALAWDRLYMRAWDRLYMRAWDRLEARARVGAVARAEERGQRYMYTCIRCAWPCTHC
jgi:hypothetical protein